MDFSLSDEQQLFQDTVRGFVANECPPQTVRAIFDGKRDAVRALSQGLAEIGVAGLVIPEQHGGAGLELLELALVAEELGRGAVPVPFLGHALATLALARGGSPAQRAAWLPRLAAGDARATVALAEIASGWSSKRPRTRKRARTSGSRSGRWSTSPTQDTDIRARSARPSAASAGNEAPRGVAVERGDACPLVATTGVPPL